MKQSYRRVEEVLEMLDREELGCVCSGFDILVPERIELS